MRGISMGVGVIVVALLGGCALAAPSELDALSERGEAGAWSPPAPLPRPTAGTGGAPPNPAHAAGAAGEPEPEPEPTAGAGGEANGEAGAPPSTSGRGGAGGTGGTGSTSGGGGSAGRGGSGGYGSAACEDPIGIITIAAGAMPQDGATLTAGGLIFEFDCSTQLPCPGDTNAAASDAIIGFYRGWPVTTLAETIATTLQAWEVPATHEGSRVIVSGGGLAETVAAPGFVVADDCR